MRCGIEVVSVGLALILGVGPGFALAQDELAVEHDPVGCVTAGRFPILEARITGDPRAVRVYFHSSVDATFYYVDMVKLGGVWRATLPSPLTPPTESVTYYLEALDAAGGVAQTAQLVATVAESCETDAAPAGAEPDITVVATQAGAPPVPAGFAAGGIIAIAFAGGGAGGLGAAAALGLLGGAAGLTAVIVAVTGEDEVSPR